MQNIIPGHKIEKTSVSLTIVEKQVIERCQAEKGLSFSASLRLIVREWDEAKKRTKRKPAAHYVGAVPAPAAETAVQP